MAAEHLCPHCGKPVPATGLQGICPECMLQAGLAPTDAAEAGPHGTKVTAAPPPQPAEIAPLFPQLEILACLGSGGMGAVYKARQPKLNRFVALKILSRDKQDDPKFAERFEREAQALARLNHPNIVTVYDFGEAGGHCYLLMEYVDGVSLREVLRGGKVKGAEALRIVPRICEALQFAHEHGIVHRDIKPENILIDREGRVKIADFGIAKLLGTNSGRSNLTAEAQVIGTPHYMAPEQVEKPQEVDHRADIYSLGVVFYEMLTGELPLGKFQPPSRKVQVDVRLDEIVLHALEKEPDRRYQHVSEVKTDVETVAQGRSPRRPRPAADVSFRELLRRGIKVGLGVAFSVALLGVLITLLLPRTYRATARIDLSGMRDGSGLVPSQILHRERERFSTQAVLAGTIQTLNLREKWGQTYNNGKALSDEITQELLRKMLEVRVLAEAAVLELHVYSHEPSEAAHIADAAVDTYLATVREAEPNMKAVILGRPTVPLKPVRPKMVSNILLSLVIGAVIGVIASAFYLLFGWVGARSDVPGDVAQRERRAAGRGRLQAAGLFVIALGFVIAAWSWMARPHAVGDFGTPGPMTILFLIAATGLVVAGLHLWREHRRIPGLIWAAILVLALFSFGISIFPKSPRPSPIEAAVLVPEPSSVPERHFVRLIIDHEGMEFEGEVVSWEVLSARLQALPDRAHTVLEWGVTSDRISIREQNELSFKFGGLARQIGLEYASYVGVHPRVLSVGPAPAPIAAPKPIPPDAIAFPVVIETTPESGVEDVDPALAEIRVTFSAPMRDGSWSLVAWRDGLYPETTDSPRFLDDQRTCVLPVRLRPGTLYGIWINTERAREFQSQDGKPAVPYLLTFQTGGR